MRVILFTCCALVSLFAAAQTKRAFVVAISDYEDYDSWKRISSVDDLPYIRAALHKFGFTDDQIDTLKNEQATRVAILSGLDRLAQKTRAGDIVLFFFAGHGQQIMDDNGAPDEQDGYDEALVAYDALGQYNATSYTGQNHVRDDDLNTRLKAIHDKLGDKGSLTVMVDACHSGSSTRGDEFQVARGSAKPFQSPDYKPVNIIQTGAANGFAERYALPNMILISASGPDQLNYQTRDENGKKVGVLAYAFAKTCFELDPGDDYDLMFEKIKARIQANKPTQVPIMEGNGKRVVFGASFTKREEIIGVNVSQWINDTSFYFNKGYLHDLTPGSVFHLSPLGKKDVAAKGYIARVEAMQSIGVVPAGVNRNTGYELVVDDLLPENMEAIVYLKGKGSNMQRASALEQQLKQMMAPFPWIRLGDPADMMIEVATGSEDTLSVVDKNGKAVYTQFMKQGDQVSPENWKEIMKTINNQVRISYLRNLPDGGALATGVVGKVIPEKASMDSLRGEYVFGPEEQFSLSIDNHSGKALYYNLLNISPGNEIKVMVPYEGKPPAECQVRDGGTYTTPMLKIRKGTPAGKEVFKIILSEQPIDLRPIVKRLSGKKERAVMSPVEKLFDDMYSEEDSHLMKKRDMSKVEVNKIGVLTVGYTVK